MLYLHGDGIPNGGIEGMIKLASLFDGIGGAPLAAVMCGATPVWASEIERYPIKVTEVRFPQMQHLGDITKIRGAEVEPVHIIVGGSPCQDLSVAGLRKGMKHSEFGDEVGTRSGLFMEQVRIIKEMRDATRHSSTGPLPRYNIWENVPGAYSSNKGEDFRAVLEETARVADPTVSIPRSVSGWATAGSILGSGWSISWRTLDSQYWGVPQRRRRIFMVADFNGDSAPKILFERDIRTAGSAEVLPLDESLRRDSSPCGAPWQGASDPSEESPSGADGHRPYHGNGCGAIGPREAFRPDLLVGFVAAQRQAPLTTSVGEGGAFCIQGNTVDREVKQRGTGVGEDVSYTLTSLDRHAVAENAYNVREDAQKGNMSITPTESSVCLQAQQAAHSSHHAQTLIVDPAVTMVIREGKPGAGKGPLIQTDKASTLLVGGQQTLFEPAIAIDHVITTGGNCTAQGPCVYDDLSPTMKAGGNHAVLEPSVFVKTKRPNFVEDDERWVEGGVSPTLNAFDQGEVRTNAAVLQPTAFSFDSLASNSMKSDNPISGCREVDISRCLDTTDPSPTKNQGGIAVVCYDIGEARLRNPSEYEDMTPTITSRAGTGGNNVPAVVDLPVLQMSQPSNEPTNDIAPTLISRMGTGGNQVPVFQDPTISFDNRPRDIDFGISGTLRSESHGDLPLVLNDQGGSVMDVSHLAATLRSEAHGHAPVVFSGEESEVVGALMARDYKGVGRTDSISRLITGTLDASYGDKMGLEDQHINSGAPNFVKTDTTVRRLTPMECERLQGYPDGWTMIDGATDSNRYKALGNSFTTFAALFPVSGCIEVLEGVL
jgi:DNA (cytosine-5)-methyltransferase 1